MALRPFNVELVSVVIAQVNQGGVDTVYRHIHRFPPENKTEFFIYYEGEQAAGEPGEELIYKDGKWLISPDELEMDEDMNVYDLK